MRYLASAKLALILLSLGASFVCSNSWRKPANQSTGPGNINNLSRSRIVPDLISRQPCYAVTVEYVGGHHVNLGNELLASQTSKAPKIHLPNAKRDKLYTIVMLDPDSPSREIPLLSPVLHYLVINAPGADNFAGDTLTKYARPGPSPGTGYHRYVFLVYEQKGRISPELTLPLITRIRFALHDFYGRASLVGPVAANFFVAKFNLL